MSSIEKQYFQSLIDDLYELSERNNLKSTGSFYNVSNKLTKCMYQTYDEIHAGIIEVK